MKLSHSGMVELISATLEKGKSFKFKVSGSSMSPFIKDGDVAVLSPAGHRFIGLGAVLACVEEGSRKLIIHRVICKKGDVYYLKGDNTLTVDRPVRLESILGQVSKIERNGKTNTFSLGPEKIIIAFLSRTGWLMKLVAWLRGSVVERFRG